MYAGLLKPWKTSVSFFLLELVSNYEHRSDSLWLVSIHLAVFEHTVLRWQNAFRRQSITIRSRQMRRLHSKDASGTDIHLAGAFRDMGFSRLASHSACLDTDAAALMARRLSWERNYRKGAGQRLAARARKLKRFISTFPSICWATRGRFDTRWFLLTVYCYTGKKEYWSNGQLQHQLGSTIILKQGPNPKYRPQPFLLIKKLELRENASWLCALRFNGKTCFVHQRPRFAYQAIPLQTYFSEYTLELLSDSIRLREEIRHVRKVASPLINISERNQVLFSFPILGREVSLTRISPTNQAITRQVFL